MHVTIRKITRDDIPKKVEWINNPNNNQYLHYDLPLKLDKSIEWYERIKDRSDRYDAVIEIDGKPCGIIGLLNIDLKNKKSEFYITIGEPSCKGKGISTAASRLLLSYAFEKLNLNRVYLFTAVDNLAAQKLFEKIGFTKEGLLKSDLYCRNKFIDRYVYGICRND